jgi:hypothetical protein
VTVIDDQDKADSSKPGPSASLMQLFSFILWFSFGIWSILLFALFLGLVLLLWIPGFLGGLTAFMPLTYFTASPILKLCYQAFVLFWTFVWMCIAGWVTVFPVIYGFGHLLYLMTFKQLKDDSSRFISHFMTRMKQLVFIYVLVAVIIAFASKDLPNETKYTVAAMLGASLLYIAYNMYMSNTYK